MKKTILITVFVLLWASVEAAQQPTGQSAAGQSAAVAPFEADIRVGYHWVSLDGNARGDEYEYLHSSPAGSAYVEWDPLPHRFVVESHYLNKRDYFGEVDYSYRDVVVFNMYTRSLFHNLDHLSFGPLASTPPTVTFTDRDPGATYSAENDLTRAFIRFKTPDFPFHLYAEDRELERKGTIQQLFLRGYTGNLDKVSQSREIDWKTREVKVGVNSHLGVIEADYSHTEKTFEAGGEKVQYETYTAPAMTVPHNLVPDLTSSSDTIKIHTSYTGRLVGSATYSTGDKKNKDSGAKADYWNAAGDVTYTPSKYVTMFVKYRHYDLDVENPSTVTIDLTAPTTYAVRKSISSSRDTMSGAVRYRPTDRLALRGEYVFESIERDVGPTGGVISPIEISPLASGQGPADWEVARKTTKSTAKVGATYRAANNLMLRADYSHVQANNPAYDLDPDRSDAARASLTWTPTTKFIALVSYSGAREKRGELVEPLLGGSRDTARDQALGSFTYLVGQRSSVTAGYAYFRNRVEDTLTYDVTSGGTAAFALESGVPYEDVAHVFSLALAHAYSEGLSLTAEGSRSYSRGKFRNSGSVPDTTGIAEFSDLRVIESIYTAGMEMQYTKALGSELRYQYREYHDMVDSTRDGTVQTFLATMSMKW